jgi:hypothetical protein
MTENEKLYGEFCRDMLAVIDRKAGYRPAWFRKHVGLCTNILIWAAHRRDIPQEKIKELDDFQDRLFNGEPLPFNQGDDLQSYIREVGKKEAYENPLRIAHLRKYAEKFNEAK